jgi:release factor glutamine methyltransferase
VASATRTLLEVLRLSTSYLSEHQSASSRLDAELLLAHALRLRRLDLYLQFDRVLDEGELTALRELMRRRGQGEPVAYITGEREFWGRAFAVTPDVLVPRPETETLVDRALAHIRERDEPGRLRVADLGTGSGCIAVTLAAECPALHVTATDVSRAALQVAAGNASRHAVADRIEFVETSWTDALEGGFDIVVSNPPYVTKAELAQTAPDVREYEPAQALDGDEDGLDAYRELLPSLDGRMSGGGTVLLEVDPRRAEAVTALLTRTFPEVQCTTIADLAGFARVIDAQMR